MPDREGTISPRTGSGIDAGAEPGRGRRAEPVDQVWVRVRARLRDEVGEAAFKSWLKPLTLSGIDDGAVRIAVPTKFMRDWVNSHYAERIRCLFNDEIGGIDSIDVDIAARLAGDAAPDGAGDNIGSNIGNGAAETTPAATAIADTADSRPVRIEDFGAALDPRYTFDHFVVGKPNELAHAAARRVAEAARVTFNPLFLYGGVGLGKTHLMHAIAAEIRRNHPERRVLYMSAEKFMYHFIRALRFKDTVSFKEMFRSVDVLMIDDVQFISGKESTQEEFFHTFNALVDQNRQVIISADKSPGDLEGMEERLKSRLGWGLVADIHPTTYELRLGILQARADLYRHIDIPNKVLEYLAHKITSNVRELEGAFNRLIANAELVGRSITLESTNELLHDILRLSDRKVTIDEIQRKVAEHYNIRVADMHSARRARSVARPRQVAMYLAKQLTARSLPEIGRKFGGRDHTTVMHAVKKIEELTASDAAFAEDVDLLRRMLGG